MPMTCAQIVTMAGYIAKAPGYASLSGQLLNAVLQELAETYDFDVQKVTSFSVTTSNGANYNAGPFALPADYLRASPGEVNYTVNGTPYILSQWPMSKWRMNFLGQGTQDYPRYFATDFSTSPPGMYFWPPANGAFQILVPYFKQHTDIAAPETSATVPWFPLTSYLYTRLAGELMKVVDDTRSMPFLKDSEDMLRKYLEMKDDPEGYAKQVTLDSQSFRNFRQVKNTKISGW